MSKSRNRAIQNYYQRRRKASRNIRRSNHDQRCDAQGGGKMPHSVLTTEKGVCYVCQKRTYTEKHHIFMNALRNTSEDMGLYVYLCPEHHRGTNGVHGMNGGDLNHDLKQISQYMWEQIEGNTREEWMKRIGRNYL